ncbi:MAG: MerR family transcriptional regulator [Erysipelotrichaceae bacterium]
MLTNYSIGETAMIHGISKQTLIYYDQISLLKPHHYDPYNHYRYYTMEEFATLDIILLLKEIGVPLNQIKSYLNHRNVKQSIDLFKQQEAKLEKKIRSLKHLQAKINNKLRVFQDYNESSQEVDVVFLRHQPLQHIIEMKLDAPGDLSQLDIATKKLMQYMKKKNYIFNYQIGTTIDETELKNGEYYHNQTLFTLVNKPLKDPYYRTILPVTYATIYFKGNYEHFKVPYIKLLTFINQHDYEIIGPAYELNISDLYSVSDDNEYITEIRIPIKIKDEI